MPYEIPLTQGKVALVSPDDYNWLAGSKHSWWAIDVSNGKNRWYAARTAIEKEAA